MTKEDSVMSRIEAVDRIVAILIQLPDSNAVNAVIKEAKRLYGEHEPTAFPW